MPDYSINLTIQSIWTISRIFFDIAIMWFLFYYAIKFVRNNARTIQIFKGIIVVLLVNGVSKFLGFTTIAYFTDMFINWGFLAIIVIFQPEIRGLLERLGKTNAFSSISTLLSNEKEKLAEEVYEAVIALSKARVGALISIEQSQSMQDYVRTGISVNATVSKELLCSVFMTTTPLHDGAVIIQGDKIACASAYFPPTNANLSSRFGARHRAALGIAEVCDALTIVVSEETSAISIAEKGKIFSVDENQLRDYLKRVICNDEIEIRKSSKQRRSLTIADEPEIVIERDEEEYNGFFANLFSNRNKKPLKSLEEVKKADDLDMKLPLNNRLKYEKNQSENNVVNQAPVEDEEINNDEIVDDIDIKIIEKPEVLDDKQDGGEENER